MIFESRGVNTLATNVEAFVKEWNFTFRQLGANAY